MLNIIIILLHLIFYKYSSEIKDIGVTHQSIESVASTNSVFNNKPVKNNITELLNYIVVIANTEIQQTIHNACP